MSHRPAVVKRARGGARAPEILLGLLYNGGMVITVGQAIAIGSHRVVFEPDLYAITFIGDLTVEQVPDFAACNKYYAKCQGYVMCVADATKVGTMTPESRRLSAELSRELGCPGATAIYGASLLARTLSVLVTQAIAMIRKVPSEVAFFKTEAEARAWLLEQRPKLIALSPRHR